jgi:hypothetical protein
LDEIRAKIDDSKTFPKEYYGAAELKEDFGTGSFLIYFVQKQK